jgi:hypothetical protein
MAHTESSILDHPLRHVPFTRVCHKLIVNSGYLFLTKTVINGQVSLRV